MTERQVSKRMNEAFGLFFKKYESEAEFYGTDEYNIWIFDIPSKNITVKMELNQKHKNITIYETELKKQSRYDYIRETKWQTMSHYSW